MIQTSQAPIMRINQSLACVTWTPQGSGWKSVQRRVTTAAVLLLLGAPMCSAMAGEQIYHFIDHLGVPHFSNVPNDPRYKPLQMGVFTSGESVREVFRPKLQAVPAPRIQDFPQTPDDVEVSHVSPNDR